MSRLYDALKGARRFRDGADGNAGEEVWEALGINAVDIPPVPTDPDGNETIGLDTVAGGGVGVVIPEEELLPADTTAVNGAWGAPATTALDKTARVIPHALNPAVAEHYRRLRTKILQQQSENPFRSLVVTSANPQEGKTVTVLNLGLSFSMLPSYRVLVVDGDMRRGTLGRWLGVEHDHAGLSNLIDGSAQLEDVILRSDEIPMHFMVRGNSQVPDLVSSQLDLHFQKIAEQFDLVLVDTPPVNLIADVQLLAASCDAVLLVARAFATTRKALEKAVQELLPFRVIGTVLNAGTEERYGYGGY